VCRLGTAFVSSCALLPALLELTDDVAAEWVLALWTMAPSPVQAARMPRDDAWHGCSNTSHPSDQCRDGHHILRVPIIKVAEV